jgi:hypothetical protein
MRPEDRRAGMAGSSGEGGDVYELPLDADLASLDAELGAAGTQARRALYGRTQPTRVFASGLRDRLLGTVATPVAAPTSPDTALLRDSTRGSRLRAGLATPGEAWAPVPLEPRLARRTPTVLPRARWALLAAAGLTGVLVFGALGARLDWLIPSPTSEATSPRPSDARTPAPSPASTQAAVVPVDSFEPTASPGPTAPVATPSAKPARTPTPTPTPTPTRKPDPTPKPEPTVPPVGTMELFAKSCPGGVLLDWAKPSSSTAHYHVLRSLGGEVPATYPADGTTDVETATSWSAGLTDGFDAGLEGGQGATYRAFAFNAEDQLLAVSPSRTVTTVAGLSLGSLGVENLGPGSIAVSWAAADVPAACFTYGKLVAATDDPEPSYLKGSPYLAAIGDPGATGVTLEGLPTGETVWMRYQLIRVTSTGKFLVGQTDVFKVTYP